MIRGSVLFWFGLVLCMGAGLFQVKHEVQILEEELEHLNRAILADQEATHVLRAEWSYLNRPERLAALSRRHLEIAPLAAAQIIMIESLPLRLDTMISQASNPAAASGVTDTAPETEP
jgi:hypothetical protein